MSTVGGSKRFSLGDEMAAAVVQPGDVVVMARCWRCEVAELVHGDVDEREAALAHFLEAHPRGTTHRPQIAYTERTRLAS
ncbi:MAG TPA: hypothetical protein VHE83_19225 [Mycobacteriales bacterium]|nr:hypothetical protein [Mycobacteriales bacterium]